MAIWVAPLRRYAGELLSSASPASLASRRETLCRDDRLQLMNLRTLIIRNTSQQASKGCRPLQYSLFARRTATYADLVSSIISRLPPSRQVIIISIRASARQATVGPDRTQIASALGAASTMVNSFPSLLHVDLGR